MDLFWRYTIMAEDANIPDLEERFKHYLVVVLLGRNLSAEKKLPIDKEILDWLYSWHPYCKE